MRMHFCTLTPLMCNKCTNKNGNHSNIRLGQWDKC